MSVAYRVTAELRRRFSEPWGVVVRGSFAQTSRRLAALVAEEQPAVVVSVGDTVSRNLHARGIAVTLAVTDCVSMRKSAELLVFEGKRVVCVRNPAGTITVEAEAAVREALEKRVATHVLVEGEEDLLTLVAVAYAPLGGIVVYGQPRVGVVVVRATAEKKAEAAGFLAAMAVGKS